MVGVHTVPRHVVLLQFFVCILFAETELWIIRHKPVINFSLAMTKPDRQLIAQVMLYSQGFRTAEILATKIVPFFK